MASLGLPPELWGLIVGRIADLNPDAIVLAPSTVVTRTLYSCLFVSRATHAVSVEQLHRRCLYIDSPWRLRALIRALTSESAITGRTIDPRILRQRSSSSLFLKPFSADNIDERNVVSGIVQLFSLLSTVLRRLIIDMPLRSYYPDEYRTQHLGVDLRNAFLSLKAIEDFVSIRDELFLSTTLPINYDIDPPVWSRWSTLRRLALYNLLVEEDLDRFLNALPNLESVTLTRPDTEEDFDAHYSSWRADLHIGVVNTWRDHSDLYRSLLDSAIPHGSGIATRYSLSRTLHLTRPLPTIDIICVDGQNPFKEPRLRQRQLLASNWAQSTSSNWAAYDLRNTFNDIQLCQDWVRQSALDGSLWRRGSSNTTPHPHRTDP